MTKDKGLPLTSNHWGGGTAAILFIYSYRLISASKMASFEYLGIPSSFVLGWIFFKEAPWEQLFPGVIAIVLAGFCSFSKVL